MHDFLFSTFIVLFIIGFFALAGSLYDAGKRDGSRAGFNAGKRIGGRKGYAVGKSVGSRKGYAAAKRR
jgi:hypothetical protein